MSHLLFIDDEQSICWGLTKLAQRMGHSSEAVGSAELGLQAAEKAPPDAIVLDVRLPGMTGLDAIEKLQAVVPDAPVVMITAYGDLETAVEAVRRGAFEYLVKPFDLQLAERTILRALAASASRSTPDANETEHSTEPDSGASRSDRIVGKSLAMQGVFKQIALVAPSSACVHLRGDSGTGKELVARAIHRFSRRSDGPFIPVNLAALNPSLAESELFGHVRGAFTGAEGTRKGLLEQADGGTIFLDEVADIPMALQVKLLRTLEHGEIWPVGADTPRHSDFRLISATHQDLKQRVADESFRHDLYFRLVTFELALPPLRDRRDDIPLLAQHFLDRFASRSGVRPVLDQQTLEELESRPWFGNVRELRNAMEHAMVLARGGKIEVAHLPPAALPSLAANATSIDGGLKPLIEAWVRAQFAATTDLPELYPQFLAMLEPSLFKVVLDQHRGQVSAAARVLGMHRTTLKKKLDEYGIHGKDES